MADRNTSIRRGQLKPIRQDDLDATNSPTDGQIPSYDNATGQFTWVDAGSGGGGGSTFKQTFVNGDLTSDKITITHNLNTEHPVVFVYDENDQWILPTFINADIDANNIELDFTGMTPLSGTYKVRIVGGAGSTGAFLQAFTNADLSSGILTVSHNLGVQYEINPIIWDNTGKKINPDDYTATSTSVLTVDLTSYGTLTGTWRIFLSSGGGTSGSGDADEIRDLDNDTGIRTEESSDEDIIRFRTAGTEQIILQDGALLPTTDNDIDLGSSSKKFKDLYLTGASLHLGNTTITENRFNAVETNIVLNAFRTAINGSLSILNLVDGITDEYEDETGVTDTSIPQPLIHFKMNDNFASTYVYSHGQDADLAYGATTINSGAVNTSALATTGKLNGGFDFNSAVPHWFNVNSFRDDIVTDDTGSIAVWVNPDSIGSTQYIFALTPSGSPSDDYFIFRILSSGKIDFTLVSAGNTKYQWNSDTTLSAGAGWYHLVISHNGTSPTFYINGSVDTGTFTTNNDLTKWFSNLGVSIDIFRIGAIRWNGGGEGESPFDGQMDDFRYYSNYALSASEVSTIYNSGTGTEDTIVNDIGLSYDATNDYYTGGLPNELKFPIEPHANMVLLSTFDGNDASTTHTAFTGQAFTYNGNAQNDTAEKKHGRSSLLLDGTGDYVTVPASTDWDFGSGDFTVDMWFKSSSATRQRLFTINDSGGDKAWDFRVDGNTTGQIYCLGEKFGGGTPEFYYISVSDAGILDGEWHHVAFVRNTTNFYVFVDGISISMTAINAIGTNTLSTSSTALHIGGNVGGADSVNGWIDSVRIVKGTAVYTSDFGGISNMTLQSIPFTAQAQPDTARVILFEEDVDSITLNTDLTAKVSRDGGTTFTTATLINEGEYEAGKNILTASLDISGQPAGTSMIYKLETANNKELKIHGTGLIWD